MTLSPPTRPDDAQALDADESKGVTSSNHASGSRGASAGGHRSGRRHRIAKRGARATGRRVSKAVARAVVDSRVTRSSVKMLGRVLPSPRVHLTRYEIVLPRLPRHLDGLRVLHLSDLHLHPGSELALQVPALIADESYDLACYTGDFINIDADIPAVATLLARMPRGAPAYAVLGNHDYVPFGRDRGANDVRRLRGVLTDAGLTVLTNEARQVHTERGNGLYVAGVDDPATRRDDLAGAMSGVPEDACALVLAHSPDVVLRMGARRPDLILAGHTHGGQIRLPRVGALLTLSALPKPLAMGLGAYAGVPLFVSRGIGYSTLNLRVGTPSEVALLTLRSPVATQQ